MGRKVTVCVGVTPALQRTLRFSSLVLGDVNRCSAEPLESASGKATNVARVVRLLNHYFADLREDGTTEAVLVEFSGGETGKKYRSLLGFESVYVETKAATRICQTLLVDGEGEATELVEEAINPSEAEWSLFAETLAKQTAAIGDVSQCVGVLTGSPPPGSSPQIYKELLLVASARGLRFIVDSQKTPLSEALEARPWLVKINLQELEKTSFRQCTTEHELRDTSYGLINAGARNVVVTKGKDSVWLFSGDDMSTYYELNPPKVQCRNPIGSGDSMAAGIAFYTSTRSKESLSQLENLVEAVRFGIACGSANAETETPGTVIPSRPFELVNSVTVKVRTVTSGV